MAGDLELIDGFEALRADYLEANPTRPLPQSPADGVEVPFSVERALTAWFCAMRGWPPEPEGRLRRRLRTLVRQTIERQAGQADAPPAPEGSEPDGAILRSADEALSLFRAVERGEGPIAWRGGFPTVASEAEAWEAALPSLKGVRVWRWLAALGRPVIVPEGPIQRLFWRLGLADEADVTSRAARARLMAEAERLVTLTGLATPSLNSLLVWHTRSGLGLRGGGRCGARPHCDGCPLEAACLWRRYGSGSGGAEPEAEVSRADPIRRLKERWERLGPDQLEDAELLALLLPGRDGRDPLALAEALLARSGGLRGLELASIVELTRQKGIGSGRALRIKAALELGRRLGLEPLRRGEAIHSSQDVWRAYRDRYRDVPQEHFVVLLLNARNQFLRHHIVSKGSLTSSPAHPREVFKEAVRHSASAVIVLHNHPSGDPEPSAEDAAVTRQLAEAGQVLGIRLLDHLILGADGYYSFKDQGRL